MDCYTVKGLDNVQDSPSIFTAVLLKWRMVAFAIITMMMSLFVLRAVEIGSHNDAMNERLTYEEYDQLVRPMNEAGNDLLHGRIYLAREKAGEAVAIIEKRVPAQHWLRREATVRRDEISALCKLEESQLTRLHIMLHNLRLGIWEYNKGRYAAAVNTLDKSLSIADALDLKRSPLRCFILGYVANAHEQLYDTEESLPFRDRLVVEYRDTFGADSPLTLVMQAMLAERAVDSSRVYESELLLYSTYQETNSHVCRFGVNSSILLSYLFCAYGLDRLYSVFHEYEKCGRILDWQQRILDKFGSKLSQQTVVTLRCNMISSETWMLIDRGDKSRAQEKCRDLCLLLNRKEGAHEQGRGQILLALLFAATGQAKEARSWLKSAETLLVPYHPLPAPLQSAFLTANGHISFLEGDLLGAERLLTEAIKIRRTTNGESHPVNRRLLNLCADVKQKLGKEEEAQQLRQRAAEITQQIERYKAERDARYRFELPSEIP